MLQHIEKFRLPQRQTGTHDIQRRHRGTHVRQRTALKTHKTAESQPGSHEIAQGNKRTHKIAKGTYTGATDLGCTLLHFELVGYYFIPKCPQTTCGVADFERPFVSFCPGTPAHLPHSCSIPSNSGLPVHQRLHHGLRDIVIRKRKKKNIEIYLL